MPREPSSWILEVPETGDIKFRVFQGGTIGKRMYKREEAPQTTHLCPVHHVEVRGKIVYICPEDGAQYEASQVLKSIVTPTGETLTLSHEELKERYPKSGKVKLTALVSTRNVTPDMLSTDLAYYLVPLDQYENILSYNQLVDLLIKDSLVGVVSSFRIRSGSMSKHVFLLFASERQKALLAIEFVPERMVVEVPEEAKFKKRLITPEMEAEERTVGQKLAAPKVIIHE
jgi:hypothetical protein